MLKSAETWLEGWGRIREKGVWRFIFWRGLLAFGLPFATLISILDFVVDDRPFEIRGFLIRLLVGGSVFGALSWRWYERRYRIHQSTRS